MPASVNGVGTHYYGKTRIHTINGICEFCSAFTELKSYDTTLYFVFFFVPLIPLGKRRVLQDCPACEKHRATKLRKWEELKRKSISEIAEALREDHENPQTIIAALGTASSYQDEELFLQIAEGLAEPLNDNAEVQLALGGAYCYFSRFAEAESALQASLAVRDDNEAREQLAVVLLKQSRPAEADECLRHLMPQCPAEQVGFLALLAEGYQSVGQHARALEIFDYCIKANPEVSSDTDFQQLRKLSEKHLQSGTPVKSATLKSSKSAGYSEGGTGARVAALVGPVVLLLGTSIYLLMAYLGGQSRDVFLVNGLDRPYGVEVNGEFHQVPAGGHRRIKVAEGDVSFHGRGDGPDIPQETVRVETSFWTRPFASHTIVMNPDRVAVVMWQEQSYAENPKDAGEPKLEVHVGEPLYQFRGLDFEFEKFPAQVKMSNSATAVTRTNVELFDSKSFGRAVTSNFVRRNTDPATGREFALRQLNYHPHDEQLLAFTRQLMSSDAYISLLRGRLDERPILVNWHRIYQAATESAEPKHDLEAEYREYLLADPENALLAYLVGRVTEDADDAEELFRRAIEGESPSPFGYNALAFSRLIAGEFEEALPFAQRAVELEQESQLFTAVQRQVLLALGRVDELLAQRDAEETPSINFGAANEVRLRMLQGDKQAAQQAITDFAATFRSQGASAELVNRVKASLSAVVGYCEGDPNAFWDSWDHDSEPVGFEYAFSAGRLEEAAAGLRPTKGQGAGAAQEGPPNANLGTHHLLLYMAAHANNPDFSQQHLDLAIKALRQGSAEERKVADRLSSEDSPQRDRLLRMGVMPKQKRVLLAALGTRFPDDRNVYFELASRLNYERTVPHLFLKKYLQADVQPSKQPVEAAAAPN